MDDNRCPGSRIIDISSPPRFTYYQQKVISFMEIKDLADAMAKIAALKNERIKLWNDIHSGIEAATATNQIISIRNAYQKVLDSMVFSGKSCYTEDELQVAEICILEITLCNQELRRISLKYIADKAQTEILSALFSRYN